MKSGRIYKWLAGIAIALLALPVAAASSDNFPVLIYTTNNPPPTPALIDLPLTNQITQWGITWTFALPAPVGRFVNGDYYVVGSVTVIDIEPPATNGYNGSMLNIQVNIQESGFDSRIQDGRCQRRLACLSSHRLDPGQQTGFVPQRRHEPAHRHAPV